MDLKRLGAKIISTRKALGWSQEELSGRAKVARGALQELEKGRGNPTLGTLEAIAVALNEQLPNLMGAVTQPHFDPDAYELARIINAMRDAEPVVRLAALLLLTGDEEYSRQMRAIPGGTPFAAVLSKLPRR